jgi:hypothetical protein
LPEKDGDCHSLAPAAAGGGGLAERQVEIEKRDCMDREDQQVVMGIKPYSDDSLNLLYNQFFADNPELYRTVKGADESYPWSVLSDIQPDIADLKQIASADACESRVRLLAFRELQRRGELVDANLLLGVILEVGLENGLDTLAIYQDGTARYINQAGGVIVWEEKDQLLTFKIGKLMQLGEAVVAKIGPWDKDRLPPPPIGHVRLSFLVSNGLYFGEASMEVLAHDAMGGPVIQAGSEILSFLVERAAGGFPVEHL